MSRSRFLQTFILTLMLPFQTDAAAPGVPLSWSRDAHAPSYLTNSRQPIAAATSDELDLSIPAQPVLSLSSRRLTLIDKAYLDVYIILRETNSCSRFFGGPRIATDVLNALYPRLKTALLDSHIGISMSGPVTSVTDAETGARYRLFKKVLVNLTGPFYRNASDRLQSFFHKVGNFPPNTREARATMLLHELGHLLPGADGRWLLPNDGNDQVQVDVNTSMIMEQCNEQIKALSR
jgi:hypothetical protein